MTKVVKPTKKIPTSINSVRITFAKPGLPATTSFHVTPLFFRRSGSANPMMPKPLSRNVIATMNATKPGANRSIHACFSYAFSALCATIGDKLGLICLHVFREVLHPVPNQGLKLALDEGAYGFQLPREAGFYYYSHLANLRSRLEFPDTCVSDTFHLAFHVNSFWRRQDMLLCPHGSAPPHVDFHVKMYGIPVPFCDRNAREEGLPFRHRLIVSPCLEDLLAGSFHDLRLLDVQVQLFRAWPLGL